MHGLTLIRTDHEALYHLFRNNRFQNADSFSVEIFPGESLYLRGRERDLLWREVLASLTAARGKTRRQRYVHFAYITLVDSTQDLPQQNLAILWNIGKRHAEAILTLMP